MRKIAKKIFGLRSALVAAAMAAAIAGCDLDGAAGHSAWGCNPTSNIAADSSEHTVYWNELESPASNALTHARGEIDETDITILPRTPSEDSNLDVSVKDGAYVDTCGYDWYDEVFGGVVGAAICYSIASDGECNMFTVYISTIAMDDVSQAVERHVLLHEMSHTLGMSHRGTGSCGCIMNPSPTTVNTYNSYDKKLIDGYYK